MMPYKRSFTERKARRRIKKITSIKLLMTIIRKVCNHFCVAALFLRPLAPAPRKREGGGGEKAATCAASLPVPGNLNISLILRKLSRLCQCSASGKISSRYCGSSSHCRPNAALHCPATYPAPAPCRTQGARGAAGTPPPKPRFKGTPPKF